MKSYIFDESGHMQPSEYWIENLNLKVHPEGGFFKETYRSSEVINLCGLPSRFASPRNFSTAIYFLLRSQDRSVFHRLKSDELWHFHYGSTLHIYVFCERKLLELKLGANLQAGEALQVVIPANCWFGAKLNSHDAYTLSSCTVAPGFDFNDFEIAKRARLLAEYPEHGEIIKSLTS